MHSGLKLSSARLWRTAVLLLPTLAAAWVLRRPLAGVAALAGGAATLAFLISPLARLYERRVGRSAAAACAVATAVVAIGALLWLALPVIWGELSQLAQALPAVMARAAQWLGRFDERISASGAGIRLSGLKLDGLGGALNGVAAGTIALAGGAGARLSELSLSAMLAVFFLSERSELLLRLELLVPQALREAAVRTGGAVLRELRLYLHAQLLVALAVGALASAGLALVGVRGALVLGGVVGLLNMVPYFGPFIGGIPAALVALGDGWQKAALAVGVLVGVQQLDSALISPRILGSLTGFSPGTVLLAVYAGAKLFGLVGMLAALPVFMSIRTVFRVFVQMRENI